MPKHIIIPPVVRSLVLRKKRFKADMPDKARNDAPVKILAEQMS